MYHNVSSFLDGTFRGKNDRYDILGPEESHKINFDLKANI